MASVCTACVIVVQAATDVCSVPPPPPPLPASWRQPKVNLSRPPSSVKQASSDSSIESKLMSAGPTTGPATQKNSGIIAKLANGMCWCCSRKLFYNFYYINSCKNCTGTHRAHYRIHEKEIK